MKKKCDLQKIQYHERRLKEDQTHFQKSRIDFCIAYRKQNIKALRGIGLFFNCDVVMQAADEWHRLGKPNKLNPVIQQYFNTYVTTPRAIGEFLSLFYRDDKETADTIVSKNIYGYILNRSNYLDIRVYEFVIFHFNEVTKKFSKDDFDAGVTFFIRQICEIGQTYRDSGYVEVDSDCVEPTENQTSTYSDAISKQPLQSKKYNFSDYFPIIFILLILIFLFIM